MRIIDLLEGKNFNDLQFIKISDDSGKKEIDFDLSDDLVFFMNNNDEAYRRHLYPKIVECIKKIKSKKTIKPDIFQSIINECYKMYLQEFPIRELPSSLNEKICNEICDKLHEEVHKNIEDGKYD
jgi:hypothetical protein